MSKYDRCKCGGVKSKRAKQCLKCWKKKLKLIKEKKQ